MMEPDIFLCNVLNRLKVSVTKGGNTIYQDKGYVLMFYDRKLKNITVNNPCIWIIVRDCLTKDLKIKSQSTYNKSNDLKVEIYLMDFLRKSLGLNIVRVYKYTDYVRIKDIRKYKWKKNNNNYKQLLK